LDIELPKSLHSGGTGLYNSMVNDNFEYRIFGDEGGTRLGGVAIERLPRNTRYYIYYDLGLDYKYNFYCIARTDKDRYICESIGGVYRDGTAPNIVYLLN
jgi:hypothetical protein